MRDTLTTHLKIANNGSLLIPELQEFIAKENRLIRKGVKEHKSVVIRDAKLSISALRSRIQEFNHGEQPDEEEFFVHPSSIGGCRRAIWYSYFGAPKDVRSKADELRSYLIFEIGTYFHILFQNLLKRAGLLVRREIPILDRLNFILGHCDGEVRVKNRNYALEIKTINSRQFTLLNAPKHAHLQQAHCYMKSTGLRRCVFVYFDKDRSETKEFVVKFNKEFYHQYIEKRVTSLRKKIRLKKLPERETEGANVPPCTYCDFASICYSEDANKKFLRKLNETHQA